jgi:hypothetical protein
MYVIITDDYYFHEGVKAICSALDETVSFAYLQTDNTDVIKNLNLTLDATCFIAVECETIRDSISKVIAKYTLNAYFIYDIKNDDIDNDFYNNYILSKKMKLSYFISVLQKSTLPNNSFYYREFMSPMDIVALDVYSSGMNPEFLASRLGCSLKALYRRRRVFLLSKGIFRQNAFGIVLLNKITSGYNHF